MVCTGIIAGGGDDGDDVLDTEQNEILRNAQEMIKRLQTDRNRKEDEIVRHQNMLRDHREAAIRCALPSAGYI